MNAHIQTGKLKYILFFFLLFSFSKSDFQEIDLEKSDFSKTYNNQVEALSAQMTDDNGTVSLYIKDGYEYLSRYSNPKVRQAVTSEETNKIISDYKIDAYISNFLVNSIFLPFFVVIVTVISSSSKSNSSVIDSSL